MLKHSLISLSLVNNDPFSTNVIYVYSRKHNVGSLDKGRPIPQASFFGHFFENGHNGKFTVGIKIIDGAEDVYSLRRKELYWEYRLETFSPKGLNERAAYVELDMFACGTA